MATVIITTASAASLPGDQGIVIYRLMITWEDTARPWRRETELRCHAKWIFNNGFGWRR